MHVWTWLFIVVGYVALLFGFRLLGGLGAAAGAFEDWGRRTSARRRVEIERRLKLR